MSDHNQIARMGDEHVSKPMALRIAVGLPRHRRQHSERSPHSAKFLAVTGALVGLGITAIAVAIVILTGATHRSASVAWSQWSPPDGGALGAREIADHVAPLYRISAVDQLAVITVVNLASAGAAAAAAQSAANGTGGTASSGLQVAVKPDPSSSAISLLSGNTIAFNLCGIRGANCAIAGSPSTNRLLLLRREALELALYTFKYVRGAQNVVAILPPGRTQQTSTLTRQLPTSAARTSTKPVDIAVLFVHQELQPWLNLPLSDTLPEQFPPTIAEMPASPEAGLVDQITARGLFSEQLQQAQDGSNLIVLDPLPPQ
jgi:hypothetical protein